MATCQRGINTRFATAAAIVHELIEAYDEKRLLRLQRQLASLELLIVSSNLPFDEWTATFGEERLTGALLDRLTHHVHILEMNGKSYPLAQSRAKQKR